MIESTNAIALILKNAVQTEQRMIRLEDALNYVLSSPVYSAIDMPPFDQSAMDGYALSSVDLKQYHLQGESKAGDVNTSTLDDKQAMRIFTGAMTPQGSLAVVRQEDTEVVNDQLIVHDQKISPQKNIRKRGEQIREGELAARAGTLLTPGTIGYLTSLGVVEVEVYGKPRVTILTTGSELVPAGNKLHPGQIYESNSSSLKTALLHEGIEATTITVEDDAISTQQRLKTAISSSDLVLVTGGISVGDYDFVYGALKNLGVTDLFYKVRQKPGKPLYAGKLNQTLIFGLPGNPAAALTCYYLYTIPAIRKMQNHPGTSLMKLGTTLTNPYAKTNDFSHHLKGFFNGRTVEILPRQSSAMLGDFTASNCLVILDGPDRTFTPGDSVDIVMLPQ